MIFLVAYGLQLGRWIGLPRQYKDGMKLVQSPRSIGQMSLKLLKDLTITSRQMISFRALNRKVLPLAIPLRSCTVCLLMISTDLTLRLRGDANQAIDTACLAVFPTALTNEQIDDLAAAIPSAGIGV